MGRDEQNNILLENPLLPDIRILNCGLKQSCYYGVKAKVALQGKRINVINKFTKFKLSLKRRINMYYFKSLLSSSFFLFLPKYRANIFLIVFDSLHLWSDR